MVNLKRLYTITGQLIRKTREERGLTQAELAAAVSLTRASITNIESGKQKLLLHTLYDIAIALSVEPSALLPKLADTRGPWESESTLSSNLSESEREWLHSIVSASKRDD